jgi:outer membrane protein OmpA-like peptidoglycan-associated protein
MAHSEAERGLDLGYPLGVSRGFRARWPVVWTFARAGVLACAVGSCATVPSSEEQPPQRQVVAKASRVADWNVLAKSLSGLASVCGAVGKSKEGEATGIAVPATCLFREGDAKVAESARPAITTIARELNRVSEREFWINARGAAGDRNGGRLSAARAQAMVGALVAAGVSAARLAAVVGIGDSDPTVYGALSGAALVEIIEAPNADEDTAPRRYGGR